MIDNKVMQFFKDEWDEFVDKCGFTDVELKVVSLMRRGWYAIDIAEELGYSRRTIVRRQKDIKNKILHRKEQQV